jgi:peptidyl-prolyl cis-trans isomerase C
MANGPNDSVKTTQWPRLLREPTLHFFAVAAAALLVQRLVAGDARTIELTPALKADILRRYHDQMGRAATSAEVETVLSNWKIDEALYREALLEGIDREEPSVRLLLINNMRERLTLQARVPEPSEAELQQFLAQHRSDYEAPLIYEHEFVAFAKQQPGAEKERAQYLPRLAAGATPASLGLRSTAANINRERMDQEFGAEVAEKIGHLPLGQWRELETGDRLLLVKLVRIQGGLPEPQVLHEQVLAGWKGAMTQKAVAKATQAVTQRYRFEEKPR